MSKKILNYSLFVIALYLIVSCNQKPNYDRIELSDLFNANWNYENDPYSGIEIKNGNLTFRNFDEQIDSSKIYNIEIKYELPKYADTNERPGSFMVLTNKEDTLYAEILVYGNGYFSFMALPSMDIVVLTKKE